MAPARWVRVLAGTGGSTVPTGGQAAGELGDPAGLDPQPAWLRRLPAIPAP
jgi:hypothetical protein